MVQLGSLFGGAAADIGNRYLNTPQSERGSIFSTAATHTDFLDSLLLRRTLLRSDFRLGALRSNRPYDDNHVPASRNSWNSMLHG